MSQTASVLCTTEPPLIALLGETLAPAGTDDLDQLDTALDRRLAALFADFQIYPAADGSDWAVVSRKLALALSAKYAPWLTASISDCCAWGLSMAIAREHIKGFKTKFEKDSTAGGPPRKYIGQIGALRSTVGRVSTSLRLSKNKVYDLLTCWCEQKPPLLEWARTPQEAIPDSLNAFGTSIWGSDWTGRTAPEKRQNLCDIARLSQLLTDFSERFPAPGDLKQAMKGAEKRRKNSPQEFNHELMSENGWLSTRIWKSLKNVPASPQRRTTIAILARRADQANHASRPL